LPVLGRPVRTILRLRSAWISSSAFFQFTASKKVRTVPSVAGILSSVDGESSVRGSKPLLFFLLVFATACPSLSYGGVAILLYRTPQPVSRIFRTLDELRLQTGDSSLRMRGRASATPQISAAPAACSAAAQASSVAPVVVTSSTTRMALPRSCDAR